jgi:plasmid stabilization system protein ParE
VKRRWSREAEQDLAGIHAYIAKDNPIAASQVIDRIIAATERLEFAPYLARKGEIEGTHELVLSDLPYIVVFRVTDETIDIHGVVHGARHPRVRRSRARRATRKP